MKRKRKKRLLVKYMKLKIKVEKRTFGRVSIK